MANYLQSQSPTFSQYKGPIDKQVYKEKIDEKEQQYNLGVQRLQGFLDTVAGLPVGNEADKKYLQELTNDLYTKVSGVAASDISDQNLVNKMQGYASRVYNDPTVQKAISSASNVQSALTELNSAKSNGKGYSVENEAFLHNQISKWQSSTEAGSAFNAQYTPYVDVIKKVKDMWKDRHASSSLTYSDGGNPLNPTLEKFSAEGFDPATVRKEIQRYMAEDAGIKQQNDISAWYNYRGIEGEVLQQAVSNTFSGIDETLEAEKNYYNEQMLKYANDPLMLANLLKKKQDLDVSYEPYKKQKEELMNLAIQEPERVKSYLHQQNLVGTLTDQLSWKKIQQEKIDNPQYKAANDQLKEYVNYRKWEFEQKRGVVKDIAGFEDKVADNNRADRKLTDQEQGLLGKGKNGSSGSGGSGGGGVAGSSFAPGAVSTLALKDVNAFEVLSGKEKVLTSQLKEGMMTILAGLPTTEKYITTTTGKNATGEYVDAYSFKDKGSESAAMKEYFLLYQRWKDGDDVPVQVKAYFDQNKDAIVLRDKLQSTLLNAKTEVDKATAAEIQSDPEYKLYKQYNEANIAPVNWHLPSGKEVSFSKRDVLKYLNYTNLLKKGPDAYGPETPVSQAYHNEKVSKDWEQNKEKYTAIADYIQKQVVSPALHTTPGGKRVVSNETKELTKLTQLAAMQSDGRFLKDLEEGNTDALELHSKNQMELLDKNLRKTMTQFYDNSVLIPTSKTEELAATVGAARNILIQKQKVFSGENTPKGFKQEDIKNAEALLNLPIEGGKGENLKNLTFMFHPAMGDRPSYLEIADGVGEDAKIGRIPLTREEAMGARLFMEDPASNLKEVLSLGTKFDNGQGQIVQEAKDLPVGVVAYKDAQDTYKYNLSYDVINQNGTYYLTINARDVKEGKTYPYQSQIPFSAPVNVLEYVNNLKANPLATINAIRDQLKLPPVGTGVTASAFSQMQPMGNPYHNPNNPFISNFINSVK